MHFFTSVLLASLLFSSLVSLPTHSGYQTSQSLDTPQTHLVQKRGQPKHRGSGRRELVSLSEMRIS